MHHAHRPAALAAAIALSLLPATAPAQDARTLDAVQVTASRVERPLADTPASVTVLSRADIERSQAPDLIDLLARQAGVDVARTGGPGSASTVFLRGGNATHALVLVDGIRVSSTGQGVFDFAHLPLDLIERIEIVRGPRAAIWGSDAISGVIHIFTRDPSEASARLHAGSYGRYGASAGFGVGDDDHGFGASAGYGRLRGFSATNARAFAFDPDRDGYENRNLGLRGHTALGGQRLGFSAVLTDADVEFDQGVTAARNASGGLTLGGPLGGGRWRHLLTLGHAREDLDSQGGFPNGFHSRRHSLDWVNSLDVGGGVLNLGLNAQRERGESWDGFNGRVFDRERESRAVFAGWGGRFGAHVLDLSVRHDHSDQYGGAGTGQLGWAMDLGERSRIRLSWGEGFRAPNFNELYYPDFGFGFAGNPDLEPERSETWEAGWDVRPADGHRLGLSLFRTRVRNMIAFAAPGTNNAINIARARMEGVELDYRFERGPFSAGGNLAWLDATDADTGLALLRRARRKAHVELGYRLGNGLELGLDGDYVSSRRDVGGDVGAYALAHLRLSWPMTDGWRLEARLENLTDRDYELVRGYETPGRSGVLSLVWNGS
ncbi:TonB-dependent receptor domain-containing protein [Arenimonas fontis]|nr:TonB-dependent receptor [Arenimonas fontis]